MRRKAGGKQPVGVRAKDQRSPNPSPLLYSVLSGFTACDRPFLTRMCGNGRVVTLGCLH